MEKERDREKERQTSALESMRMSEGSERRRMEKGEKKRVGERESEEERRITNAGEGGSQRNGASSMVVRSRLARERSVEVQENRLLT